MNDVNNKNLRRLIIAIGVLAGIVGVLIAYSAKSQHHPVAKFNVGIVALNPHVNYSALPDHDSPEGTQRC